MYDGKHVRQPNRQRLLNLSFQLGIYGAPGRIRTRDPLITNQVLYQLSYKGTWVGK